MVFFVNDVVRMCDEVLRATGIAPERNPLSRARGVVRRVNACLTPGSAPGVEVEWVREDGTTYTEIMGTGLLQLVPQEPERSIGELDRIFGVLAEEAHKRFGATCMIAIADEMILDRRQYRVEIRDARGKLLFAPGGYAPWIHAAAEHAQILLSRLCAREAQTTGRAE